MAFDKSDMQNRIALPLILIALGCHSTAMAQAFIEQLSPPVLQRGAVNRIEILGSDIAEAVGLWSSLPADLFRVRPVSDSGSKGAAFNVEVTSNAPLGLYGLRLATRSGLSNVHLFLVDELPVTRRTTLNPSGEPAGVSPRTEPTAQNVRGLTPSGSPEAIAVKLPACITANCRPAATDRYAIEVAKGQRVAFEVIGSRLGKDYDPLVRVRDAAG